MVKSKLVKPLQTVRNEVNRIERLPVHFGNAAIEIGERRLRIIQTYDTRTINDDPHTVSTAIFSGKPGLTGCPFNAHSPFVLNLNILWGQIKTFHIILDKIPPSLHQSFLSNLTFTGQSSRP